MGAGARGTKAALLTLLALLAACSSGEPAGRGAAERLRASFPEHAERLLAGERAFVEEPGAFALAERPGARSAPDELTLRLPRRAEEPMTVSAGELMIRVRELGTEGEGERVGGAVLYPRRGGTSLWTGIPGGFEEWLVLEAGAAREGRPAAAWEVEGASLREAGEIVEIVDASGVARIRVSAPVAYARSGQRVPVRLEVEGPQIALVVGGAGEEVLVDPSWTSTTAMITTRSRHTGTELVGGEVLVAGGIDVITDLAVAERYDPASNTWSPAGAMAHAREKHTATRLQDGKVLVAGGFVFTPPPSSLLPLGSAERYDPTTNTWAPAAPLAQARYHHTATLLPNGKVLVAGGAVVGAELSVAELYDPAADTWSPAAPMSTARGAHSATLLPNGKVLVTGGTSTVVSALAGAELYDPATDTWSPAAPMPTPHGPFHAATLLSDGRVLVSGSNDGIGPFGREGAVYDPASDTWSPTGLMVTGRASHRLTLLPNGRVLAAGGSTTGSIATASAELYDPASNSWLPTAPLLEARTDHTASLLPGGKVLLAGTKNFFFTVGAEVFSLSALGDPCSSGAECLSGACVDGVCCDTACDAGACDACSVAAGAPVNGTCALLSGTPCDDGNPCTQADHCTAGSCDGGAPVVCPAPGQCHLPGVCNPATGTCSDPLAADGAACNDGDACTQADVCEMGACTPGGPVACPPPEACHANGACDPLTGTCSSPAEPDGTPCPGGLCMGGACAPDTSSASSAGSSGTGGTGAGSSGTGGSSAGPSGTGGSSTGSSGTGGSSAGPSGTGGSSTGPSSSSAGAGGASSADVGDFPSLYGRAGCYCDANRGGGGSSGPVEGLLGLLLIGLRRRARERG